VTALLWWLVRDAKVTIHESHITNLRAANIPDDVVRKFETLVGQYRTGEFAPALQKVFGEAWPQTRASLEGITYQDADYGEVWGLQANGSLGQNLYIFPKAQLVFVRMTSDESYQTDEDGFSDFSKIVTNIAKSL
jgi:hypothetical protein